MTKTLDILRYYAKIREFLKTVLSQRNQLIKEINYLSGKIDSLKFTKRDMINFYSMQDKYYKVELKRIVRRNDSRFISLDKDLDTLTVKFAT